MDFVKPKIEVDPDEKVAFETIRLSDITPSMKPSNFKCGLCGFDVKQPANLIKHRGSWSRLEISLCVPCGICGLVKESLKRHGCSQHEVVHSECCLCGKAWLGYFVLKNHKISVHSWELLVIIVRTLFCGLRGKGAKNRVK